MPKTARLLQAANRRSKSGCKNWRPRWPHCAPIWVPRAASTSIPPLLASQALAQSEKTATKLATLESKPTARAEGFRVGGTTFTLGVTCL